MSTRDDLIALVLIAFGGFVVWEAARMPRFEHLAVNPYTVPGLVPGFLGGAILLFGLVMLTRSAVVKRLEDTADDQPTDASPAGESPPDESPPDETAIAEGAELLTVDSPTARPGESLRRLLITLGLTLGYAAGLVGRLPFWLATFVFVFAFIVIFDWRKAVAAQRTVRLFLTAGVQALLVAAAVTLVFERLFLVRLP